MSKLYSGIVNWQKSIRTRLLIRFWSSLFLFTLLIGFIQYQNLSDFLLKGQEETVQTEYTLFTPKNLEEWTSQAKPVPKSFPDLSPGVIVALYSSEGHLLGMFGRKEQTIHSAITHEKTFQLQIIQKKRINQRIIIRQANGNRVLIFVKPVYQSFPANDTASSVKTDQSKLLLGYILIESTLTQVDKILSNQLQINVIVALLVLILGGFTTFLLLRKPLQPLLEISHISDKIAQGHYDLRIPSQPGSAAEIEHLGLALNHMLGTMENALTTERQAKEKMARFIADASHELRTPLTSIRGFLEILLRRDPEKQTLRSAHQTMLIETERLIKLTEDLLTLNRLAENIAEGPTETSLTLTRNVLPDILPLLRSLAGPRTLDVVYSDLTLPLKPEELKQILFNMVQNAIQHTSENGLIDLGIAAEPEGIAITVADNGEGIAPVDLPHVFERFYRGNRSRQKQKGQGAGLGLAIVGDIVKLRRGTIKVESKLGKGSKFSILFPQT